MFQRGPAFPDPSLGSTEAQSTTGHQRPVLEPLRPCPCFGEEPLRLARCARLSQADLAQNAYDGGLGRLLLVRSGQLSRLLGRAKGLVKTPGQQIALAQARVRPR